MDKQRYITLWRRIDRSIDWDFCVSENEREAGDVVRNLVGNGVKKYSTYSIGDRVAGLSSDESK